MKSRLSQRAIRIVSQCATAEEFMAAFHPYLERDALFIATGSPEQAGQMVRFVMTLARGETVLRGSGLVLESHRDRGNFYGLRGMKLQFDELDESSRRALAALQSRASAWQALGAPVPVPPPADVIECLIYDEPETESSDPTAVGKTGRQPAPRPVEGELSLDDDDVTAVAPAPRPPPSGASPGRASVPPQRNLGRHRAPTQRTTGPLQTPAQAATGQHQAQAQRTTGQHNAPAQRASGRHEATATGHGTPPQLRPPGERGEVPSSFMVARSRPAAGQPPDEDAPDGTEASGGHPGLLEHAGYDSSLRGPGRAPMAARSVDLSELPTNQLLAPQHGGPAHMAQATLRQPGPAPAELNSPPLPAPNLVGGSGPRLDYEQREPSQLHEPGPPGVGREELSRAGLHRLPQLEVLGDFPLPGDFMVLPETEPAVQLGLPRPPLPAERTEIVWVRRRPGFVRTAAVSGILGALLGLGAGYLLWGEPSVPVRAEELGEGAAASPPAAEAPAAGARLGDVPLGELQWAGSPQVESLRWSGPAPEADASQAADPAPAKPASDPARD